MIRANWMRNFLRFNITLLVACGAMRAFAGSEWNQAEYDLYPGDFDNDGKTDILYVAKDDGGRSGIALADSNGQPTRLFQDWGSAGFGIAWHSNIYKPIVADFTGDGKADILMQRQSPGNHYLLVAGADGKFAGWYQEIPNGTSQLDWSGSAHRLIAGKFNGDNRADLFFQSTTTSGVNAILLADANGRFTSTSPHQSWNDLHLNVRWSVPSADVYAGDFNADGKDDLLVQAEPKIVMIDFDVPFPVPVYPPGAFGIVFARDEAGGGVFRGTTLADLDKHWDRKYLGLDWSAKTSGIVLGTFDSVAGTDILLQSRQAGRDNVFVLTGSGTQRPETVQTISNSTLRTASTGQNRLLSGAWGGAATRDVYIQAPTSTGTNYVAQDPISGGVLIASNPFTNNIPVAGTAVGVLGGAVSVDSTGASNYNIPIEVPPGIAGMKPELALQYSSRGGNGLLGEGWNIAGLSVITRCPMTVASDGFTDGVDFDDRDAFCMDGARLKVTSGSNGSVGAIYGTEIETFQGVESVGGVANSPDSFTVRAKSGTIRYYGITSDSKILAQGDASKPYVWALKRTEDRYGNFVEFEYAATASNSSYRPSEVRWGRGPLSGTRNIVGRVHFEYDSTRPDPVLGYFAGFQVGNSHLLKTIEVFSRPSAMSAATEATRSVAMYYFAYELSSVTSRSLMKEVVKCDGGESGVRKCLASTKFKWQSGTRGFATSAVEYTGATFGSNERLRPVDINSDGRTDYIFTYGSSDKWGYASGRLSAGVQTSFTSSNNGQDLLMLDWDNDGNLDIVQGPADGGGNYSVIKGNSSGGLSTQMATAIPSKAISTNSLRSTVGDFDGDGRQDMAYAAGTIQVGSIPSWNLKIHLNGASGFTTETATNSKSITLGGFPHYQPGSGGSLQSDLSDAQPAISAINFDGDGRDDLLVRVGTSCTGAGGHAIAVQYSCSGQAYKVFSYDTVSQALVQVWSFTVNTANPEMKWMKLMDANGDGLTDALYWSGSAWRLRLGTGSASQGLVSAWSPPGIALPYFNDNYQDFAAPGPLTPNGSFNYTFDENAIRYGVVMDYDRDGRSDIMFVTTDWTGSHHYAVLPGGIGGFQNKVYSPSINYIGLPKFDFVADNRGDGVPDLVRMPPSQNNGDQWQVWYGRGPSASDVIVRVTEGLGSISDLQYLALSSTDANGNNTTYEGATDFLDNLDSSTVPAFPYQNIAAPLIVVSQVAQDNGVGSVSSAGDASSYLLTKYKYAGLKMHRQGRGILGFSRVTSQNENTKILTINEYGQRWPYTGTVVHAVQKFGDSTAVVAADPDLILQYQSACESDPNCPAISPTYTIQQPGPKLTETVNDLSYMNWSAGNRVMPYVKVSTETKYRLVSGDAGTPQPEALYRKMTEYLGVGGSTSTNRYDDYGNPYYIKITVDNGRGGDSHTTTTSNVYDNYVSDTNGDSQNDWCLGRLSSSTVAHSKADAISGNPGLQSIQRNSTFTYRPAPYCDLETETQDQTTTANSDQTGGAVSLTMTTTHSYDSYGNKNQTLTSVPYPSGTPSRAVNANFDATQGQFARTLTNALSQTETNDWDPRFGVKTTVTGPNLISTSNVLDGFGRAITTTPIDKVDGNPALPGLNNQVKFYWCANSGSCADSRSVTAKRTTGSDGAQSWEEYDRLNRLTLVAKVALDGRWIYQQTNYDLLGRAYAKSQPFFAPAGVANATKCWTVEFFDLLGRTVREESNYVEASGGDSCQIAPPAPGVSLSGSIRKTEYQHDVVVGALNEMIVTANAHDSSAKRVTYKQFDSLGILRLVAEEENAGACGAALGGAGCPQIEYDHDALGNTTFVRRSGQLAAGATGTVSATAVTKTYFDARGLRRWTQDPDLGDWRYDYNGFGEVIWQRDSKNQVSTLTYDSLGRMRTRTEGAEGTSYFNFDETAVALGGARAIGQLTSVSQPGGYEERYAYDGLGRLVTTKRKVDGLWNWIEQTYDSQSRVDFIKYPAWTANSSETAPAPDSERLVTRNIYNAYGYQTETYNQTTGITAWKATDISQYGITKETLGNGVVTERTFEAATGRLSRVTAQKSGSALAQDMRFEFYRTDSLQRRADYVVGRSESLTYDGLARVKSATLFANAAGTGTGSIESYAYDGFGNIASKGAAGAMYDQFDYRGAAQCDQTPASPCRPGAVRSVRLNGGAIRTINYDANGNLQTQNNGAFTSIDWTAANLAKRIYKNGSEYADFSYAPDRTRFKQLAVKASGTETTIYIGGMFEKFSKGTNTSFSYYIKSNSGVMAVYKRSYTSGSLTTTETRYLHSDHLGSIVLMTNDSGTASDRMSFDTWGKRRDASTWSASAPGSLVAGSSYTTRGFTGHEQVDFVAVVHMNGRIYDAELGRFLSADPFVTYPESTQGFNRYSYCSNNPLTYTDPSGFSFVSDLARVIISVVIAYYTGYWADVTMGGGAIAGGFVGGFTSGFLTSGGDLESAMMSGLTGSITAGIGHGIPAFDKPQAWHIEAFAKAVVHGAVQGAFNDAMGGDFGSGATGGFFSSFVGEGLTGDGGTFEGVGPLSQIAISSILGGTAAVIGGGKFANGASSAAFVSLFNATAGHGFHEAKRLEKGPKFEDLLETFDGIKANSAGQLGREIGGSVQLVTDYSPHMNSCALKISRTLNQVGETIREPAAEDVRPGADGKSYPLSVAAIKQYLTHRFGNPVIVEGTGLSAASMKGRSGIIVFDGKLGDATGHVDLFVGAEGHCANRCYFPRVNRVLLWEFK